MEIWGLCGSCDRWFYCEGWFDRDLPAPTCPVCGTEPTAIENRAARADVVIDVDQVEESETGLAGKA